jgi:kumamolisin
MVHLWLVGWAVIALVTPRVTQAQTARGSLGTIIIPKSSVEHPEDRGVRAHTNVEVEIPPGPPPIVGSMQPSIFTPGGFFETPASLACVYGQAKRVTGCNPNTVTAVASGGSGAIGIVDAYDDPDAASDLATFSSDFGLPAANFEVVYAAPGSSTQTSIPPPQDPSGGWELEESVDIEMAHAMAPKAKIILVEANSSGSGDLNPAVTLASDLVAAIGNGEVSMSWGFSEFNGENNWDSFFTTPNIVYFNAAGDGAGVYYPSASPNVVSVGGTTLSRNPVSGNLELQSGWYSTGGGPSAFEPIPDFQSGVANVVGTQRGTPDVALIADGRSGVWILDSIPINGQGGPGTFWIASGTSVSTPLMQESSMRQGANTPRRPQN